MSYRKRRIGHGDGRGHDRRVLYEILPKFWQNFANPEHVANFAKILPKFCQNFAIILANRFSLYVETHKTVSFEQADGSFEAEAADAPTGVARQQHAAVCVPTTRGREQGAEQTRDRLSRGPPARARASSKEVRAQAF
jgi:hypothetical protein